MSGRYTPERRPVNHRSNPSSDETGFIIQRLVIVHWKLSELSNGSSVSDGDASDGVAGEEILYSYNTRHSDTQQKLISFIGLCRALYQVPEALNADRMMDAQPLPTQQVVVGKSMLTFAPLESPGIVALIQTQRHVTPSAVRLQVLRCHGLFCLLRGGSIHARLQTSTSFHLTEMQYDNGCRYPGMDLLYQIRKRQDKLSVSSSPQQNENQEDIQRRLQVLHNKADALCKELPISTVRRDLQVHYDAFVGELEQRAATSADGGVFRSIVDEVPAPSLRLDGSHALLSSPRYLSADVRKVLVRELSDFLSSGTNQSRCLGASLFFDGALIASCSGSKDDFAIPDESSRLLLQHMSSFRYQMSVSRNRSQSSSRSSTPTRRNQALPQLVLALRTRLEDYTVTQPCLGENATEDSVFFLGPPPLAQLSALDEVVAFDGPYNHGRVWGLPITLSLSDENKVDADNNDHVYNIATMVSLYVHNDFSILLFLRTSPDASGEHDESCFVDLFEFFVDRMASVLDGVEKPYNDHTTGDTSQFLPEPVDLEPGIDVVFIDRKHQKLHLYTEEVAKTERPADQRPGFSSMFSPSRTMQMPPKVGAFRSDSLSLLAMGLDCRHFLSSHLTLDELLALEESLAEMSSPGASYPVEVCTFLSRRWVYCYAECEGQELYILFDVSSFVTVADILTRARKVRDWLDRMC